MMGDLFERLFLLSRLLYSRVGPVVSIRYRVRYYKLQRLPLSLLIPAYIILSRVVMGITDYLRLNSRPELSKPAFC